MNNSLGMFSAAVQNNKNRFNSKFHKCNISEPNLQMFIIVLIVPPTHLLHLDSPSHGFAMGTPTCLFRIMVGIRAAHAMAAILKNVAGFINSSSDVSEPKISPAWTVKKLYGIKPAQTQ